MSSDLTDRLHEAADGPVQPLDHTELRRRARHRRMLRHIGTAAAAVALVAGVGAVVLASGLWPTDQVVIGQDPSPAAADRIVEAMDELDGSRDFERLQPEAVEILNGCLSELGQPEAEVPDGYFAATPQAGQVPPYAETDPERGFGYATQPQVLWFSALGLAADGSTPLFEDVDLRPADGSTPDEQWSAAVDACTREGEQHVRRVGMPEPLFEAALEARDLARERIEEEAEPELAAWQECMGDLADVGDTPQQLVFHKASVAEGAVANYVNSNDPPAGPPPPKLPDELAATLADLAEAEVAAAQRNQQCLVSSGLRDTVEQLRVDAATDVARRTESNLGLTEPPLPGLPDFPVTLDLPPEGAVAAVHVGERPVFVVHLDTGDVLVVDAISPHDGRSELPKVVAFCRDPWVFETEDGQTAVNAPGEFSDLWHGSLFAVDGSWLGGPAPTGLPAYEVRSVGDNTVEVGPPGPAPDRGAGPFTDVVGPRDTIAGRRVSGGDTDCATRYDQTRSAAQPDDPMAVLWHEPEYPDRWLYPFNSDGERASADEGLEPVAEGEGSSSQPQEDRPTDAILIVLAFIAVIAAVAIYLRRNEGDGSLDAGPSPGSRPGPRRFFDFGPSGWFRGGKTWLRVAGVLVAAAVVAVAFWQLTGGDEDQPDLLPEPPTVTGSPVLTASGGDPFAWVVTVSPGEDGLLCAHGVIGQQAEDRTGEPCSAVVGPEAVGNQLFGSGGGSTNPEGQKLAWGLVDPTVTEIVVELADGSTEIATIAVAGRADDPGRVALWAFATEGDVTATIARAEDGTEERLGLQEDMRPPAGATLDLSELPGLEQGLQEPPIVERGCGWPAEAGTHADPRTELHSAVLEGDITEVEAQLRAGVDPNVIDERLAATPLQDAVFSNCPALVELLLDAGADPSLASGGSRTALSEAVNVGNPQIVDLLLAAGADPSQWDGGGKGLPPLHEAVGTGRISLLPRLIDQASDIDVAATGGDPLATGEDVGLGSALEFAAEGRVQAAELLIEAGATPTRTAVYRAVSTGNTDIVLMLIDAGAPMSAAPSGRTLKDVAADQGHDDLAEILDRLSR